MREREREGETRDERESQGALMFVVQAGDLNTVATLKLGCCNDAERWSSSTVLGMHFQLGLEISGLVGHVYPRVCVSVRIERGREREKCERVVKLQRQHTRSLTPSACSFCLHVCVRADELCVCEDMLNHAQHSGCEQIFSLHSLLL